MTKAENNKAGILSIKMDYKKNIKSIGLILYFFKRLEADIIAQKEAEKHKDHLVKIDFDYIEMAQSALFAKYFIDQLVDNLTICAIDKGMKLNERRRKGLERRGKK